MNDAVEADADWEDDFLLGLVQHGVEWETAEACVREALAHCAQVGERPEQAFGDADQYAERIAAVRVPASKRARTGYADNMTMDEYWGAPLVLPGYVFVIFGLVAWIEAGLWIDLSVAGLVFGILLAVAFAIGGAAHALRAAGHLRAALIACCVAFGMSAPIALAAFELPHTVIARIPPAAMMPAGALLIFLGTRMQRPGSAGRRASAFLLRLARRRDAAVNSAAATDRWLRRLEGLLRGRHEVRRAQARHQVAEVRAHLAATGTGAEEEFGDVEQYARSLVEHGGVERPSNQLLDKHRPLAFFGLCLFWLITIDWHDLRWYSWGMIGMTLVSGVVVVRHYLGKWRKGSLSSPGAPDSPPDGVDQSKA
jgi:hypothetical protein